MVFWQSYEDDLGALDYTSMRASNAEIPRHVCQHSSICLSMPGGSDHVADTASSLPTDANSSELDDATPDPVIIFMPEISKTHLGGTMRLGLRPTIFQENTEWSKVRQLYGGHETIWERHRHRYEVNPEYVDRIEKSGLMFTGKDEKGVRMQVAELKGEVP